MLGVTTLKPASRKVGYEEATSSLEVLSTTIVCLSSLARWDISSDIERAEVELSASCAFHFDVSSGCNESSSNVFFEFCRATMVKVFASGAKVVSCEITSLPTRPTPGDLLCERHHGPKTSSPYSPMIATLTPVMVGEEEKKRARPISSSQHGAHPAEKK